MSEDDSRNPRKVRRISRACDYCHHRSIRCKPGLKEDDPRCQNCADFEQPCTFNRPVKRRGKGRSSNVNTDPSAKKTNLNDNNDNNDNNNNNTTAASSSRSPVVEENTKAQLSSSYNTDTPPSATGSRSSQLPSSNLPSTDTTWRPPQVASQAVIMDLVEIYFEVVYPIFPLFHRPTFLRKVSRGEYYGDRFLFAATMAVCALASARARDGAIYSARWSYDQVKDPPSEVFFEQAAKSMPVEKMTARDHSLNAMRACAFLAITSIQYGQIRSMHQYLGRYHALVSMDALHNEVNWPRDIGFVEIEERRRLFWSLYSFDIYSSIIWGGMMRSREGQADVSYPTEIDDEHFDDAGLSSNLPISPPVIGPSPNSTMRVPNTSWLCGWNFTTDLYRILEHAICHFHMKQASMQKRNFLHDIFGVRDTASQASVLGNVIEMYSNLPQCFKETPPVTHDLTADRFGFQAANLAATIQLLRMVLFAGSGASIDSRCQVASDVVNAFVSIPAAYLRAISLPLLHHLAGIGQILGSIFEEPLCEAEYLQLRSVLLAMAQLLTKLDFTINSTAGASERVKALVSRVDDYMVSHKNQLERQKKHQLRLPPPIMASAQDITRAAFPPILPAHGSAPGGGPGGLAPQHIQQQMPVPDVGLFGPGLSLSPFQIPQELLDDWPWTFNFVQTFD